MKSMLSPIVILCGAGFLAFKAVDFGDKVAADGMATLNTKFVGRCLSLSDGRKASILSVRGKNLRVTDTAKNGNGEIFSIERVPDLERYLVQCPPQP